MEPKEIPLHEGMMIMEKAIVKAKKIKQGYPETKFTTEEYMRFYECVYCICTDGSNQKKMQLYEKFRTSLEDSIFSTVRHEICLLDLKRRFYAKFSLRIYCFLVFTLVLPSLMLKGGVPLLRELLVMWSNYKLMARRLSFVFEYLDCFFICQNIALMSLNDLSVSCFQYLVFRKLFYIFEEAVMSMIKQEREGSQIDGELLKNIINIFAEIEHYRGVFWCLMEERKRASRYLRPGTEVKLVQVVKSQLLEKTATKLMEKRQAEMCGVVTDYQDILSKCASMNLEEGSSSTPEEWLSNVMASSGHIR